MADDQERTIVFSLASERLDREQLLDLLDALRRDLRDLPEVTRVEPPKPQGVLPGAKGIEVDLLNTVVTLGSAVGGGGLVTLLIAWLKRNKRVELEFEPGNQYGLKKLSAANWQEGEAVLQRLKAEQKSPIIQP